MLKLTGSKAESDFREELKSSHEKYFHSDSRLKSVLESHGHPTANAYVLHLTPRTDQDFYVILVAGDYLLTTAISRFDTSIVPDVERSEIREYLAGRSRTHQIKLSVAVDLAHQISGRQVSDSTEMWWKSMRPKYNVMLVIAGILSFVVAAYLTGVLPAGPQDNDMFTIMGIILNGIGYLFFMLIANQFYKLGAFVERSVKPENPGKLRSILYYSGTLFSVGIPAMLPVSWVIRGWW